MPVVLHQAVNTFPCLNIRSNTKEGERDGEGNSKGSHSSACTPPSLPSYLYPSSPLPHDSPRWLPFRPELCPLNLPLNTPAAWVLVEAAGLKDEREPCRRQGGRFRHASHTSISRGRLRQNTALACSTTFSVATAHRPHIPVRWQSLLLFSTLRKKHLCIK